MLFRLLGKLIPPIEVVSGLTITRKKMLTTYVLCFGRAPGSGTIQYFHRTTVEALRQLSAGCQGRRTQLIASHLGIFCVMFMRLRVWITLSETESFDAQSKYRMWAHYPCVRLHKHQLQRENPCWKFRLKQTSTAHTALNKHHKF